MSAREEGRRTREISNIIQRLERVLQGYCYTKAILLSTWAKSTDGRVHKAQLRESTDAGASDWVRDIPSPILFTDSFVRSGVMTQSEE